MADHKITPGHVKGLRGPACTTCGASIYYARANKLIRKRHWRHYTWQQAYIGERAALRAKLGIR